MEILDAIMKWIVAPVAGYVWFLHGKTQMHGIEIAVLKATAAAQKEAHDREFKELRDTMKSVVAKLDSIEQALRK
ncbi:hypothetical protein [Roseicyclus sp.]|uniref:hypothetical protein n=1 Tax=Roseicyclus sp. TaxID=1914329 RepID=UPI003F6B1043